jgi:hypothetical protein
MIAQMEQAAGVYSVHRAGRARATPSPLHRVRTGRGTSGDGRGALLRLDSPGSTSDHAEPNRVPLRSCRSRARKEWRARVRLGRVPSVLPFSAVLLGRREGDR